MMYRVFLYEGSTSGGWNIIKEDFPIYEISAGEILAWYHNCPPDFRPSIESQLRQCSHEASVYHSLELIDNHILIQVNRKTYEVNHLGQESRSQKNVLEVAREIDKIV